MLSQKPDLTFSSSNFYSEAEECRIVNIWAGKNIKNRKHTSEIIFLCSLPSSFLPPFYPPLLSLYFSFLPPPLTFLSFPYSSSFPPLPSPLLFYPISSSPCLPSNSPSSPFLLSSYPFVPPSPFSCALFPPLPFFSLLHLPHFSIAGKAKQINALVNH